jgi:glyoxylase-like metal-dependent hydrolase (beta-lactamase superfamily II)
MTRIHHLNCGYLHVPPGPRVGCHCLLLEDHGELALVDTGIGLADVRQPLDRLGQSLIDMAGFQFVEEHTALRQIERLGFHPSQVTQVAITHCDPDHVGGLADFPQATIHVSAEEIASLARGSWRYLPIQFAHEPRWQLHGPAAHNWFGLEARPLPLRFDSQVLLIPLFGHTHGHCGVAVQQGSRWELHVGDAYYLRVELETGDHPVSQLAAQRADDDAARRASLGHLRRLARDHAAEVTLFGYHDLSEFAQ